MIFIRCPFFKSLKCVDTNEASVSVDELVSKVSFITGIFEGELVPHNGCKQLFPGSVVSSGSTVHFTLSLPGGKGGFGSMLRAIGAQIEKTTNREACRDLSGRRLRDINEEQRLKKWLAKKVEREAEAERRHKQRLERLKERPKHDFNDPEYNKMRSELPERIDDALSAGLKKSKHIPGKNQLEDKAGPSAKKPCLWLDGEVSSDSDSDDQNTISEESTSNSNDSIASCKDTPSDESGICCAVAEASSCYSTPSHAENEPEDTPPYSLNVTEASDTPVTDTNSSLVANIVDSVVLEKPENDTTDIETPIKDLAAFKSVQELEELGLEKLKTALMGLGLKCGGTLSERAERLWSVRGLDPKDFPSCLRVKAKRGAR